MQFKLKIYIFEGVFRIAWFLGCCLFLCLSLTLPTPLTLKLELILTIPKLIAEVDNWTVTNQELLNRFLDCKVVGTLKVWIMWIATLLSQYILTSCKCVILRFINRCFNQLINSDLHNKWKPWIFRSQVRLVRDRGIDHFLSYRKGCCTKCTCN
jgi:hypothetical protein